MFRSHPSVWPKEKKNPLIKRHLVGLFSSHLLQRSLNNYLNRLLLAIQICSAVFFFVTYVTHVALEKFFMTYQTKILLSLTYNFFFVTYRIWAHMSRVLCNICLVHRQYQSEIKLKYLRIFSSYAICRLMNGCDAI